MSKELAIRNDGLPSGHEMEVYKIMAKGAISSGMYRQSEHGVIMIMLAARELGIPPMAALNGGLNVIQGKVEISARMMNALIRKAGHSLIIKESTDEKCTVEGIRADNKDSFVASYTIEDAKKAGLVKPGGGWAKFPKDMCFARALSRLARQLFSDVIGIGYVEGEIQENRNEPESTIIEPAIIQEPVKAIEEKKEVTDVMVAELMKLFEVVPDYREVVETFTMETMGVQGFKELTYDEFVKVFKDVRKVAKEAEESKEVEDE